MPHAALDILRRVNDNLRSALVRLRPERRHCSTLRPQISPNCFARCLRHPNASKYPRPFRTWDHGNADPIKEALEKEALEYPGHLKKLKHFLPDLHARLLAEPARLQTARAHAASASAWARLSKKTL